MSSLDEIYLPGPARPVSRYATGSIPLQDDFTNGPVDSGLKVAEIKDIEVFIPPERGPKGDKGDKGDVGPADTTAIDAIATHIINDRPHEQAESSRDFASWFLAQTL